jgi:hypothetical protein
MVAIESAILAIVRRLASAIGHCAPRIDHNIGHHGRLSMLIIIDSSANK